MLYTTSDKTSFARLAVSRQISYNSQLIILNSKTCSSQLLVVHSSLVLMRFFRPSILLRRSPRVTCLSLRHFTWLHGNNPRNTYIGQLLHPIQTNHVASRTLERQRFSSAVVLCFWTRFCPHNIHATLAGHWHASITISFLLSYT